MTERTIVQRTESFIDACDASADRSHAFVMLKAHARKLAEELTAQKLSLSESVDSSLGASWDPRNRLAYVMERLEEILPCDDDNRPIEAHARKVVEHHKAILKENADFDDAEHKATAYAEECRRDAERYRWLRHRTAARDAGGGQCVMAFPEIYGKRDWLHGSVAQHLDAALDVLIGMEALKSSHEIGTTRTMAVRVTTGERPPLNIGDDAEPNPVHAVGHLHRLPSETELMAAWNALPAEHRFVDSDGAPIYSTLVYYEAEKRFLSQGTPQDRFTSYERNLLGSCSNWLRAYSNMVWAHQYGHSGLMMEYHRDIDRILAGLTLAPPESESAQCHPQEPKR